MHLTYTTTRILLQSSVARQRPATSHHSLWGISWHWYFVTLVICEFSITDLVRSVHTYTTTRILLESSVTKQRPATSHHLLWGISWHLYFVTLVICGLSITDPARNAPYSHHNTNSCRISCHQTASGHLLLSLWDISWHWYFVKLVICKFSITDHAWNAHYTHHNKNSPRIFCHQTASGHLPTLPMGHLLTFVFCDIGNFCNWHLLQLVFLFDWYVLQFVFFRLVYVVMSIFCNLYFLWTFKTKPLCPRM